MGLLRKLIGFPRLSRPLIPTLKLTDYPGSIKTVTLAKLKVPLTAPTRPPMTFTLALSLSNDAFEVLSALNT